MNGSWSAQSLLGRLEPAARDKLLAVGVAKTVGSGQVIMREGAEETFVVLLENAITKVTIGLSDGRQALMAIRMSGDLVGEISALNGTPRSATVTACQQSRIRILHRAEFQAYLRSHPDAAMAIAGIVADKLRWSNGRRTDFALFPVKVRLARVLSDIAGAYGRRAPSGVVVDLHITQAELGTLCGAAEASLQKAMKELRAADIVEQRYRGFVVRDVNALREAAHLGLPM
ncbi:Crp/Fnr family transcriptional regulator [Symbioplanes lichenis]|uniref:Crp/Fnr family transcriptional regulator n=1 Tax=Symbioplanes lichenis TaxID=1629072 RepID=UPI0027392157|nr:Crp/Fnr family transcriptional regulator [Actinoplanes lichenis]